MTESEAAAASRAERPMLVYLFEDKDAEEDPRLAVETDKAFTQSEKVSIGARFFDCVRIEVADAAEDRVLKKYVRKAPCLVFVRPNFEPVTVQRMKFNGNKIFSAMCKTMRYDYENCVKTVLKEQGKIGKMRMTLQQDKDKLERLRNKIAGSKSDVKRRRLEKERDKLEAMIDKFESNLLSKENALYVLDPKENDKAEA